MALEKPVSERVTVPANLELEQALLGAIIVNNDAFGAVSGFLRPSHFLEPIHARIFEVQGEVIRAGKVVTPLTLKTYLPAELDVGQMTLGRYIARLAAEATTVLNAEDYGREIQALALRRQLLVIGEDVANWAVSPEGHGNIPAQVADAEQRLYEVSRELTMGTQRGVSTAGAVAEEILNDLDNPKPRVPIVPTGLRALDRLIGGCQPGNLIVIAGRPGMMKTTLASSIALNVAGAGYGVDFKSMEMPRGQLVSRMMADIAFQEQEPLTYEAILNRRALTDRQRFYAQEAGRQLRQLPLIVDPQPGLTVAEISVRARRRADLLAKKGIRLALLVVDHLGKIAVSSSRRESNRHLELGEMTNALADLSKELELTAMVLCQLSREVDKRDNKRPTLIDLRESGRIEEDADVVIGNYREAYYLGKRREDDPGKEAARMARYLQTVYDLEALVLKNRNGPDGVGKLWVHPAAAAVRDTTG